VQHIPNHDGVSGFQKAQINTEVGKTFETIGL